MNEIFYNSVGRLRSGWRFAFFLAAFIFLTGIISLIAGLLFQNLAAGEGSDLAGLMFGSTVGLFIAILLGWFCGRIFEDLPFRALGASFTKFWLKDFVLGMLIGLASIAFAVLIAYIFGGLRFEFNDAAAPAAILSTIGISLVVFFFGAAFEEALIRGYMFQTLVRADLAWLAILLTSLIFAAGHLNNPNAEIFSTLNTALAGIWLGLAYLKTRTLWLVFGLHLAWNWFQGAFFGIEVSGLTELAAAPLLKELDSGPAWITGGEYGIEGGLACTVALIASTALIWFLPVLKPSEEMYELTSGENPVEKNVSENV
jgi:uncharacterized protein